jgi:hypothetical protein
VHGGVSFADVLETKLGTCTDVPPSRGQSNGRSMPPPLFLFGGARVHFAWTPYASIGKGPARRARPSATLTAAEQRAFAALNDLGADLDDAMSSADLRRAFRRLAREHHPDRHPDSSDDEKVRLSRLFAALTDHYRLLAASMTR